MLVGLKTIPICSHQLLLEESNQELPHTEKSLVQMDLCGPCIMQQLLTQRLLLVKATALLFLVRSLIQELLPIHQLTLLVLRFKSEPRSLQRILFSETFLELGSPSELLTTQLVLIASP